MFIDHNLVSSSFKSLKFASAGKTGLERTSGLTTFLAFDALLKSKNEDSESLDFSPLSEIGRENRVLLTGQYCDILSVRKNEDNHEWYIDDFGHLKAEGRNLSGRFGSNFLTTILTRGSELPSEYPGRPGALLRVGERVGGSTWGIKKHEQWTSNIDEFLSGRVSTSPWTDLACVVFRKSDFEPGESFIETLKALIREKYTDQVSSYWISKLESENFDENADWYEEEFVDILNTFAESLSTSSSAVSSENTQSKFPLNTILFGPPGTGKTYETIRRCLQIVHDDPEYGIDKDFKDLSQEWKVLKKAGQISFVTFHQSYSYEDFVEGMRPVITKKGEVVYEIKDGVFKELAVRASQEPDRKFVLIIDEINRGNISRIFGELITLIETDKRIGCVHELSCKLPLSTDDFGIPGNLFIIGTMNTADRSIALVDIAIRRRFSFNAFYPKPDLVSNTSLRTIMTELNINIVKKLGEDHALGHAYFMDKNEDDLPEIVNNKILPLLQEYFYDQIEVIRDLFQGTGIENMLKESPNGMRLKFVSESDGGN